MTSLVIADHDNGSLKDSTFNAVTAAAELGDVDILVAGHNCSGAAEAAAPEHHESQTQAAGYQSTIRFCSGYGQATDHLEGRRAGETSGRGHGEKRPGIGREIA